MTNLVQWQSWIPSLESEFNNVIGNNKSEVVFKQECEFAKQAFEKNITLTQCEQSTIEASIKNVAATGLTLNPAEGFAYLVPESVKVGSQFVKHCQLRPSFRGLIHLATSFGEVVWIDSDVIYSCDTYIDNGVGERPTIQKNVFAKDKGEPVGVYCVAKLKNGDYLSETMDWLEVLKIKSCAKTKMVWDKWPNEMAKKAVIKRAYKQWPQSAKSNQLTEAVGILNEFEGNEKDITPSVQVKHILEQIKESSTVDELIEIHSELSEDEIYLVKSDLTNRRKEIEQLEEKTG